MKLLFVQTGGTIDKDYPHTEKGWAFEFGEPAVDRLLTRLNPSFDYESVVAFQKDSLEITDMDRQILVDLIREQGFKSNIITHGTDTIIETGLYLEKHLKDQMIILTGAMRPERFTNTDAPLNLGVALGAANLLSKGVYIAMNGLVKAVDLVKRDKNTGKFY